MACYSISLWISLFGGCILVGAMPVTETTTSVPFYLGNINDAKQTAEEWLRNINQFYIDYMQNNTALSVTSIQDYDISKAFNKDLNLYIANSEHNLETRLLTLITYSINISSTLDLQEFRDSSTQKSLSALDITMQYFFEDNMCNALDMPVPESLEPFEGAVDVVSRSSSETFAFGYSLYMLRNVADAIYNLTRSTQLCST